MFIRTLGALTLQLVGVAAAFGWHASLTNSLGAAGSGVLFLAVSIATTLGVLSRFGGDTFLVSTIAQATAIGRVGDAEKSFRTGLYVALCSVAVMAAIGLPLSGRLGQFFAVDNPWQLTALTLALLLAANLFTLCSAALRGLGAVEWSVIVMSVLPHLGALILFWATNVTSVPAASVVLAVGWLTAGVFGLICVVGRIGPRGPGGLSPVEHLRSSTGLYHVAIAQMLINFSGPLFVGAMAAPRDVALYATAARITQLVSLVQLAINTVSGPRIVAFLASQQTEAAVTELRKSARLGFLIGLGFLVCVIALERPILGLFGSEFSAARPYVVILAAGQFLNVSAGCLGYALLLTSYERLVRSNVVIFGVLFVFGAIIGGWRFGGLGIAAAAAGALGFQNVALFLAARHSVPWLQRRVPRA